ncbi:hypothetical protein HO133_005156 [Letharia lupina]|uniref:H/ACA ribonucleoprotein complex subunit n=1 Tax=Letharia lupina TaxID=560253 RepID=A0A8H6C9V0_9LECA|nr:uncharacterized protein HO133_005156 [Letharia lupina]KAF6219331.1 hypothetical protein HO133_005156 [Letharia lupina]
MSFRGAPRGRGGSFGGSRGGAGARGEMGSFVHACEGEMVCESVNPKLPYFNAPIYLENKTSIGKVDEVLGPINQVFFTIKPQEGIVATSFKAGDRFYIGGDKLLPLENAQVVLQEVALYVEAVVEAEAPPEARQEVEEVLVIEDEGVLGEEEEEGSVLGEVVEEVIPILQGLALVGEDHSLYQARRCGKRRLVYEKGPKMKSVQFNTFD